MADLTIYLCGTVSRKTNTAGIGMVACTDKTTTLMEKGEYVGQTSRNEAGYLALNKALERAVNWNFGSVDIYTDNELMFKQLKGVFDVRDKKLKMLHERACSLLEENLLVNLYLIDRETNKQAYELAKAAANLEENIHTVSVEPDRESPLTWKVIAFTPKLMLVEFNYPKGLILPLHKHLHEQTSYLVKGKLKYAIAGRDIILTKGTGLAITGQVEHQVEALADSREIVSYYPMRFDLLPKKEDNNDANSEAQVQTTLFG
ncbi:reverse transcriptase-like protein [Thermincola ferriacetica]